MRLMGSPLLVAPGRPADVDPKRIDKPANEPFPTVAVQGPTGHSSKYWSNQFHYPEFRSQDAPRPERQLPVQVDAVLTLRNQRGEVVDIQLVPVVFRPEVGTTVDPLIPVEQYTIDILAVMLADQTTPGKWTLTWQEGGSLDEGPIISALHRAGHDKIPGGCAPCDEKSRTITPKEPIVVTVPVTQEVFRDNSELHRVLSELMGEISQLSDSVKDIDDLRTKVTAIEAALPQVQNAAFVAKLEVEGLEKRVDALEKMLSDHATSAVGPGVHQ